MQTLLNNKKFDICNPDPDAMDIENIAHALSLACRFGSQINQFYSVAQHSINCYRCFNECFPYAENKAEEALICLVHDISEAYTQDVISPIKKITYFKCGDKFLHIKEIEKKIESVFTKKYGIPTKGLYTKLVDDYVYSIEESVLTKRNKLDIDIKKQYPWFYCEKTDSENVKKHFLNTFYFLEEKVDLNKFNINEKLSRL